MLFLRAAALAACLALAACAAEVTRHPTELKPGAARAWVLQQPVSFHLDSGYPRQLVGGTAFQELGTVPQGRVLKPVGAVLTVEGAHMHEAYAVVRDGQLVGFYLPVEKSFSPLSQPVSLPLQERNSP